MDRLAGVNEATGGALVPTEDQVAGREGLVEEGDQMDPEAVGHGRAVAGVAEADAGGDQRPPRIVPRPWRSQGEVEVQGVVFQSEPVKSA